MPKTKTQTRQFNVMLSEDEHERLRAMAAEQGVSSGQIVRMALRARASFCSGRYCCADGSPCMVPQMHQARG